MQRAAVSQGVASSNAGPCGNENGHSPQNGKPAIQSSQGQGSMRRAAVSQGAAGSNAGSTLRGSNAIGRLEQQQQQQQQQQQEEDIADLFGTDDEAAPQGVAAEEGEPQQDGFEEAVQGPPEAPPEDLNPPRRKRNPCNPTKEEVDRHNLTHANYRSWCPVCNRAALREDPHYKQTSDEVAKGLPCISFDYKTMGESPNEDDKITTLVGRDRWTKVTFAHVVKGKGLTDENIISKAVDDIESLGYPEVRL